MKVLKEWSIELPWGKLALLSWGNGRGKSVLLVHGRQDSAITFQPLLQLLSPDFYYVAIDMPGNGKSDPLPIGVSLTRFFGVFVIDLTIQHLGWTDFYYIGHSMASEQGLFYNAIYPGKMKKIILLDPTPSLQRIVISDFADFYVCYDEYYSNYNKYNKDDRVYTKAEALKAVMKARDMTEKQAELILSRNLKNIGNDKYKLSWDKRFKVMAPTNLPPEHYYELFTANLPPSLYINANQSSGNFYMKGKKIIEEMVSNMKLNLKNFIILNVDGNHDVHFIHPERICRDVCEFLERDFDIKSKL